MSTQEHTKPQYLIAFAGNPNVGKTALINAISGSKLKVGNWPGVTVEKKEAFYEGPDYILNLVDLPGTYSLTSYTIEERVTRQFFLTQTPDLIVNVIDTPNFERNLKLTLELCDLECPMVMALNIWDQFEEQGHKIDQAELAHKLGIPNIATSAPKKLGLDALKQAIVKQIQLAPPPSLDYPSPLNDLIDQTRTLAQDKNQATPFLSLEHLAKKEDVSSFFTEPAPSAPPNLEQVRKESLGQKSQSLTHAVLTLPEEAKESYSERIDRLLLNPWTGLPSFLGILYLVFKLTFDLSGPFIDWVDGFFNQFLSHWVAVGLAQLQVPEFLISLIKDGVIGGVGLVLTFVPVLFFLYLFLALLEESGYMARAAFLMDRFMYRFGLHGKAFVPLLVGFGCNVPAVYATRALEKESERKITVAVMSFMSCGAKLPIYTLFTAVFFQKYQAIVILSLYLIGVFVAIFWALVLRKTKFKDEIPAFVMELAPYRFPTFKMLWISVWGKTRAFIEQAGTVIAVSMIVLWALVNLPYGVPPSQTILGQSAQVIAPVFTPQGFGDKWEAAASIIPGFMAKEMVVGTLGVVLSVQTQEEENIERYFWNDFKGQITGIKDAGLDACKTVISAVLPSTFVLTEEEPSPLTQAIGKLFTPLSAFSYMVFNLLLLSCISVVGAVTHEFGARYFVFIFFLTSGTAYVVSALVYQIGRLFL